MVVKKKNRYREKDLFEEWLDTSFPEKLISIMWCGLPYIVYMILDGLTMWVKVLSSISIWILLTLLCWYFAGYMSSDERHWN